MKTFTAYVEWARKQEQPGELSVNLDIICIYANVIKNTFPEEMQAVVEQIVEEKWKEMVRNVGDINLFKARISDDIESVKQEVLRTQKRLEDIQVAVLGRVKDYNESVLNMGNDMKALEQVMSKIIEPLTQNVKDLNKLTEELKHHKK